MCDDVLIKFVGDFLCVHLVELCSFREFFFFFFFNDTATTEIYTLSLHDALPICGMARSSWCWRKDPSCYIDRSEEHTSELQSPCNLVCRLLLEKKKKQTYDIIFVYEQYALTVEHIIELYPHTMCMNVESAVTSIT